MQIRIDQFKGMIPKLTSRSLPNENASIAVNTRLRSTSLESFSGPTTVATLNRSPNPSNPINTIYPMDRTAQAGGPFWLSWLKSQIMPPNQVATVARVPILSDPTEGTIFTGVYDQGSTTVARPKYTNIALAITTPVQDTAYPYDWIILGVPEPTPALTVSQVINPSIIQYQLIDDGSSLTNWNTSTTTTTPVATSVTVSNTVGNPAPSIDMHTTPVAGILNPPVFINRDLGAMTAGPGKYKYDFGWDITGGNVSLGMLHHFGCDSSGNGFGIFITPPFPSTPTTATVQFVDTSSWGVISSIIGSSSAINVNHNISYTYEVIYTPYQGLLTHNLVTVNITDTTTGVVVFSQDISTLFGGPSIVVNGGFVGMAINQANPGPVSGSIDFYIDNLYQGSLLNNPLYEATSWEYTYVNKLGHEGPPSPPTGTYFIGPGIITTLSGFNNSPEADYGIVSMNLYRAVTGTTTTAFQFEANLPIPTTTYIDTLLDSQLGEVITTELYSLPPVTGTNIISMANGITMLSAGNTIYPSATYAPYAYPISYTLAVDFPVVSMQSMETYAIITTAESTYMCIGSDPSQMSLTRLSSIHGGVSQGSMVRVGSGPINSGVMFASSEGIVFANYYGCQLLTEQFITEREWIPQYAPNFMVGAIHEEMYYGIFFTNGGVTPNMFLFNQKDQNCGFVSIQLPIMPTALFSDHLSETLYLAMDNLVRSWDTNINAPIGATWRSKVFQMPYPTALMAGQIRANNPDGYIGTITMNLYKNREGVLFFTKVVHDNTEFVCPDQIVYEIQAEIYVMGGLEGVNGDQVDSVQLAQSMEELT